MLSKKIKAQISLELATAFVCILILLIASVKLCTWLAGQMVVRQENYENSRAIATDPGHTGEPVNEPTQRLDFFR
jgi:hypothetical protein